MMRFIFLFMLFITSYTTGFETDNKSTFKAINQKTTSEETEKIDLEYTSTYPFNTVDNVEVLAYPNRREWDKNYWKQINGEMKMIFLLFQVV